MHTKHHDCSQVMSKVLLALDGELNKAEEEQLMKELQDCSCCLEHFQIEKSFKEFLCARLKRTCCLEKLATEIKGSIKQKLFKQA